MTMTPDEVLKAFAKGNNWHIEANAGAGKTYTLELIVAHLIASGMFKANEILLVTFTIKAATELRARVRKRLRTLEVEGAQREAIHEALALPDALWNIQTIHRFCQNALLEFALLSGATPHSQIISESDLTRMALDRLMRNHWLRDKPEGMLGLLDKARTAGVEFSEISDVILKAWNSSVRSPAADGTPEKGAYSTFEGISDPKDEPQIQIMNVLVKEALKHIGPETERLRTERGFMTFNSMISDLHTQLNVAMNGQLLASLRKKYGICIVDEFQDTDLQQWEIFQKIFCESQDHSFICVGDPKQSIYSFRGADIHAYNAAQKWLEEHEAFSTRLQGNWRSSPAMVDAVNNLLRHEEFETLDYQKNVSSSMRPHAGIWADEGMTQPLEPIRLMVSKPNNGKLKLNTPYAIAREIHRLMQNPPWLCVGENTTARKLRLSDIMILTSGRQWIENEIVSGDQSIVIAALNHFNIPYWVYRHEKLFLMPEVQTLLDVFLAALQPEADGLKKRALSSPLLCGVTATIWEPDDNPDSFFAQIERSGSSFIHELGTLLHNRRYNDLLSLCRERMNQFSALDSGARNNIELALEQIAETALAENLNAWQTLTQLKEWITAGNGADEPSTDAETDTRHIQGNRNQRDAVTLITWHSAKGCEAPVTFVTGGFYGGGKPKEKKQLKHNRCETSGTLVSGFGETYAHKDKVPFNKAESRRLQYVVLTRASALMYLPVSFIQNTVNSIGSWKATNEALKLLHTNRPELDIGVFPIHWGGQLPPEHKVEPHSGENAPSSISETPPLRQSEAETRSIIMRSYSSLKKKIGSRMSEELNTAGVETGEDPILQHSDDDTFNLGGEEHDEDVLEGLGGRELGIFVHSLFEQLDWTKLKKGPDSTEFGQEVDRVIGDSVFEIASRFSTIATGQIAEAFRSALTTPLVCGSELNLPDGIWQADDILCEVDFHLPDVFERSELSDRKFFKGYIDLAFMHQGKLFFLDWKTDRLEQHEFASQAALRETMVKKGYDIQLQLYSRAIFRSLPFATKEPEAAYRHFGGGVYLFIRQGERGVYFERPSLAQITQPMSPEFDPDAGSGPHNQHIDPATHERERSHR